MYCSSPRLFSHDKPVDKKKYLVCGKDDFDREFWCVSLFDSLNKCFILPCGYQVDYWYLLPEENEFLHHNIPTKEGNYLAKIITDGLIRWEVSLFDGKRFVVAGDVIGWISLPSELAI